MFNRNEANEEALKGIPTKCRFPSLIEEAPFDGEEHGGKGQNTFYWFFVDSKETLDKIQHTFYSKKPCKLEGSLIGQFICVETDCNGEEVWEPPITLHTCLKNVANILSTLGLTMSVTGTRPITKYYWTAKCDDGCYEEESQKDFGSKEEAYNDMREAALDKMKWNTEFHEDFYENDDVIDYKVTFSKDEIVHKSYSGVYTYTIHSKTIFEKIQLI